MNAWRPSYALRRRLLSLLPPPDTPNPLWASERKELAARLIAEAGRAADYLAELETARKRNTRPRVSNDNPFSESQFKTLKYSAGYPGRRWRFRPPSFLLSTRQHVRE